MYLLFSKECAMKFQVKTTALAILVSLGVVACNSNDTPNQVVEPKPVNSQTKPTEPTTKPTEPTTKPAEPTTKPAEPTIIKANKLDKNGESWRHIRLTGENSLSLNGNRGVGKSETATYYADYPFILNIFGENSAIHESTFIDIDKVAPYQGLKEGSIHNSLLVGDTSNNIADVSKLNYKIINQPYSSYGVLFTDAGSKLFAVIQNAGYEHFNAGGQINEYFVDGGQGNVGWNDKVVGDATYRRRVFAVTRNADDIFAEKTSVQLDGTVDIKAHFDRNYNQSYMTGTINSTQMGKITLPKTDISNLNTSVGNVRSENYAVKHGSFAGDYEAKFGGKDFSDVVGSISLENSTASPAEIKQYHAVFGATKK